jgi:crotonobetainyl-CoA:carnitine CoA-transferase CaiB-like acyl-CoA transferase
MKYSETPGTIRLPPPLLGEHTAQILQQVLGYGPEQIEALREQAVV